MLSPSGSSKLDRRMTGNVSEGERRLGKWSARLVGVDHHHLSSAAITIVVRDHWQVDCRAERCLALDSLQRTGPGYSGGAGKIAEPSRSAASATTPAASPTSLTHMNRSSAAANRAVRSNDIQRTRTRTQRDAITMEPSRAQTTTCASAINSHQAFQSNPRPLPAPSTAVNWAGCLSKWRPRGLRLFAEGFWGNTVDPEHDAVQVRFT